MSDDKKPDNPTSVPNVFREWIKPAILLVSGFGFLVGAVQMIDINEYAVALGLLVLSAAAFLMQLHDWKGIEGNPVLTERIKGLLFIVLIVVLVFFGGVVIKSKGDKAWSNWFINEPENKKPVPQPTPTNSEVKKRAIQLSNQMVAFLAERDKNKPDHRTAPNEDIKLQWKKREIYDNETREKFTKQFAVSYQETLKELEQRGVQVKHADDFDTTNGFAMWEVALKLSKLAPQLPDN